MAIERLKSAANSKLSIQQTYRHDLESFFYVFLAGCIEYEFVDEAKLRNLDKWCKGEIDTCYLSKYTDILDLEIILDKFTPSFVGLKELAKSLRTILFKDENFFATPEDRGSIYRRMIMAFDKTIKDIKGKIDL
ncbi:Bgt-20139 [Blumeria graminis f. sp. tritici]|uniref:Bgt-20139 n=2 Tax=Blumeria graminis f. sp. tritici TaxID=62690 RepID=A0A9X9LAJ0_BLUGR|nr:Bgt-20139 [Blumeria graminis f. sp. tritici]